MSPEAKTRCKFLLFMAFYCHTYAKYAYPLKKFMVTIRNFDCRCGERHLFLSMGWYS